MVCMADAVFALTRFPIHLGRGGTAIRLDDFDGSPGWYERYGAQYEADGADGRLVSYHTFEESWSTWEVHPIGEELVVCVEGTLTLHQEIDGETATVTLHPGEAIVNPPGAWHTADVDGRATALFITAGRGTQIRPR